MNRRLSSGVTLVSHLGVYKMTQGLENHCVHLQRGHTEVVKLLLAQQHRVEANQVNSSNGSIFAVLEWRKMAMPSGAAAVGAWG